jgi:hypothetical protein
MGKLVLPLGGCYISEMSADHDTHTPMPPAASAPVTKMLRYEIDWHYTPADFFPGRLNEQVLGCDLTFEGGTVLARVPAEIFEVTPSLQRQIHRWLDTRFKVQQFRTAKTYELSAGSLTEYRHDGGRIVNGSVTINCKATVTVEAQILDSGGNVIFDTAAERARLKTEHEMKKADILQLDTQIEAALKEYYDQESPAQAALVESLLTSDRAACNDPEDELVYLYELRDGLSKHFGGEGPARQALGITRSEWSDFGKLANDAPVRQGRHRGKFPGELRAATDEELIEARRFAKKLLLKFLMYLNQPHPPAAALAP